ncbi:T9SS type A sorting domain-containing protein [Niastella caeni]|uniref:T9SS type A sorting domain-containing protein n=1 Tax=Niastella caeni TaxID=2569763 RepID=A0A4S8HW40_9BACT|nr:T9SS type A sorting domain-containing protein [Niastella caeni]THU39893.1 T9SS type A sorting domain-containing protein [Niastella caeni]
MKKIYSFIMVSAIALTANAQIAFFENFSGYTNGDLGTQGGWTTTTGSPDVQVANSSPLIYPGYTSGTQYITVSSENGKDPRRTFTGVSTSSGQHFYISFVVRVTYAELSNEGPNHSIALFNTGDADRPLRFFIAEEASDNGQIRFGIATGDESTPSYTSTDANFELNTTYLIVIRYSIFSSAGDNDDAYLWVNPSLASEPSTTTATGTTGATMLNGDETGFGSTINAMEISQSHSDDSPDAEYDGFRVAYGATSAAAWTNLAPAGAPLPVRLTSFNAAEEGLNTKLVWNTAEESGITSYVVEKSADGRTFTAIGSVKAANSKTYSFTDMQPASEFSYYRLKMVEMDGTYKYSYIISVKSKLSMNISLSPNPVKNILMVQHPKAGVAGHIQIIGANGQTLKDIRLSANAVISNIDMSGFTSGLYHIVFKNGAEVFSKTVLKQ